MNPHTARLAPLLLLTALTLGHVARADEWPATLAWAARASLSIPVAGQLAEVIARPGQSVAQGEVLARLDAARLKAALLAARADAAQGAAEEADAQRDLERVKELYARTVSSTTELDAAQLRHARAQAAAEAARARREQAERLVQDAELRAPYPALILDRHAEPGMVIAPNCQPTPLLTVARADVLLAVATLDAGAARGLKLDAPAEVLIGDQRQTGRIEALRALDDGRTRLSVQIARSAGIHPGQSARIRLP